jgi:hypothetical protein
MALLENSNKQQATGNKEKDSHMAVDDFGL